MQRENNWACLCNEETEEIRNASKGTGISPKPNANKEHIENTIYFRLEHDL
jgi:hypothetical protein